MHTAKRSVQMEAFFLIYWQLVVQPVEFLETLFGDICLVMDC